MQSSSRKAQMLDQVRATHQPLEALLDSLDEARMTRPGVNGEWSVKDLLAHITWWEQHLLRRLRTGREDLYQEGADIPTIVRQANAEVFAANRTRALADVLADFHASYHEVLATLEQMPEGELASDEIFEAVAVDTFQHYPEHIEALQAWLASGASGTA